MDCLPEEIIVCILSNLNETKDVLNFSITQKRYYSIVKNNKDVFSCIPTLSDEVLNEIDEFLSNVFGRVNIETTNYNLILPFIGKIHTLNLSNSEIEDVSLLAPKCRVTFSAEHPCGQERSSCGAKRMH